MSREAREHLIDRALAYPYAIPETSYVFQHGEALPFTGRMSVAKRTPVLCIGSNQSPEQLARKFPQSDGWDRPIPMLHGWLENHDIVYAAHFARYGALPATLARVKGTRVSIFVAYLDDKQLVKMHVSEGLGQNYDFIKLRCDGLILDDHPTPDQLHGYVSRKGVLAPDGAPVALEAIKAENRKLAVMNERDALNLALKLADAGTIEEAVPRLATEGEFRGQATDRLVAFAKRL